MNDPNVEYIDFDNYRLASAFDDTYLLNIQQENC